MPNVRQIAQDIVAREGGYVNDPADPGGPTKYGVTLGTLRALAVTTRKRTALAPDLPTVIESGLAER